MARGQERWKSIELDYLGESSLEKDRLVIVRDVLTTRAKVNCISLVIVLIRYEL